MVMMVMMIEPMLGIKLRINDNTPPHDGKIQSGGETGQVEQDTGRHAYQGLEQQVFGNLAIDPFEQDRYPHPFSSGCRDLQLGDERLAFQQEEKHEDIDKRSHGDDIDCLATYRRQ